jgi:CheY-like chemotaxis protein
MTLWTVLIIDDQPEEVGLLIRQLEREGYRVLFAASGQSGLESIAQEKPDIIICDLEMPGLDGYDVLEAVAAEPETRNLPFILMNDEWTVGPNGNWSCSRNGKTAVCHLTKPLDPREILCFVGRIAEASRT